MNSVADETTTRTLDVGVVLAQIEDLPSIPETLIRILKLKRRTRLSYFHFTTTGFHVTLVFVRMLSPDSCFFRKCTRTGFSKNIGFPIPFDVPYFCSWF